MIALILNLYLIFTDEFQFGGLHIFNLDLFNYEKECFLSDNILNISKNDVTFISFDARVSSIAPVFLNSNLELYAVVAGLDDGSIQLVTLKNSSCDSVSEKVF